MIYKSKNPSLKDIDSLITDIQKFSIHANILSLRVAYFFMYKCKEIYLSQPILLNYLPP